MLIIEEPELHLHPQLQKHFLTLLEEISHELGVHIIMTTHSPLMINERNIKNVYRFHTHNGTTSIVNPGPRYTEDTSKLMQILKFTNTAKIFFVQKIIMVE
jgi:putative ATP-dependent endonuclease of the OLD family